MKLFKYSFHIYDYLDNSVVFIVAAAAFIIIHISLFYISSFFIMYLSYISGVEVCSIRC